MRKTEIFKGNLDNLLKRFFDGETTCAEEKLLQDYFCNNNSIPKQYECYREMFHWYASGMDDNLLPDSSLTNEFSSKVSKKRPKISIIFRKVSAWISVAAAVAILISMWWHHQNRNSTNYSMYAGSYVEYDGIIITGEDEIMKNIEATLSDGYCLDAEIDAQIALLSEESELEDSFQ